MTRARRACPARKFAGDAATNDYVERIGRRHPALWEAMIQARRRFSERPGVAGIGFGRAYSERKRAYRRKGKAHGGMVVKVYVARKRSSLPAAQRIPKWIVVRAPGARRAQRVGIDVVSVAGSKAQKHTLARMHAGRGWPSAGAATAGRLFAFATVPAAQCGPQLRAAEVELGTIGALVRTTDQTLYGISAGHVFTEPCRGVYTAPRAARALGADGRTWERVPDGEFYPGTIRPVDRVRDVMAFSVPARLAPPSTGWPPGFTRELATPLDIDRAVLSTDALAFTWAEPDPSGPARKIPADVEAAMPFFKAAVRCGTKSLTIDYALAWPLRFTTTDTTTAGDSGAGVFILDADGVRCRLLGFHFLEWGKKSYAMDAREFLRGVFGGDPGSSYDFA